MQPLARCCFSAIVLLLVPGAAVCCGPTEYQWTTNEGSGCCSMCPPGKYLVSRCERFNEDPNCAVCPTGKYTAGWNTHSSCARCKICSKESGAAYSKKCEKDANAECSCGKGKQLTAESNSCEQCPPGSYSDEEGNETCKPWTCCEENGQQLIKNGSSTENVECGMSKITTTQGRSSFNPTTVLRTTMPSASTRTSPSVTTANQPATAVEDKFYIGVIVVAALIFLIVLIKRRKLYLKMKKQDFYHCLGIKKDIKGPVQEEANDITSVQV
ncbi:tumor necrosis factor receptor superfamily member 4-like [Hemiscyllium ocellatum]|uniref:tumor necrosis factor receptor superfamily member 4-like n=1 Tax=Hemiscyllium ocellatum TaxID=170820 RepID=UPI002966631E|nr:tumor necrosis factor receptor superfamily member 4-like [Hemiscyllium ocellatum]